MNTPTVIQLSPLFSGITASESAAMLTCLSARKVSYKKNAFIFRHGEKITSFGMVLFGSVHIIKEDIWGNRHIIGGAGSGDLFGEAYACSHSGFLEVSALASQPSDILFLDIKRVLTSCSNSCEFHSRLIQNLLSILAEKNLMLNKKIEYISKKTLRSKILSYLSDVSIQKGSSSFEIPFNRQQLADYLSADRSALSNELSKMRDEGLLSFQKNHFVLSQDIF